MLMQLVRISFALLFVLAMAGKASAQDELDVLYGRSGWMQHTDSRNALYHHFTEEAYDLLARRRELVAAISSLEAWKERQQWITKTLRDAVGPFPEKTDLNAKVLRTVDKDFYRIEHIVYESQPRFYVTSSLFIPKSLKKRQKAPAVIYCSGHSDLGYRSDVYQHVILNLVRKGFIVFAFDPVGQGERLEYLDREKGKSAVGGPTTEHSYPGTQAFISGDSQARYMIWDGIRAVDYLLTRKEVDGSRIGITGRSGGGTQSSYIAAFDERIAAAAPECYITSFTRLLQSIGPQDAEQNFFNGIARGLDHGDLLIVRAPKPTMMITTTRDIFSIQGARETAAEVSRAFEAYGADSNFSMVEDDAPHASTEKNRVAMYAFFQKHLKNPGSSVDEKIQLPTAEELKVTATGQVSTSLGGTTVFAMNVERTNQISPPNASLSGVLSEAKSLSGYREPEETSGAVFTGRIQRDGYAIEKYFVQGEGDYVVPYLLFAPADATGKVVLYLHPAGKAEEAAAGGEIEQLARQGYTVVTPDLPGVGELGAGQFRGDAFIGGISHNIWYSAMLIGRSITGLQAGDIARILKSLKTNENTEVYGLARKEMSAALLHAAAFTPSIKRVALVEPLSSFRSLVESRFYFSPFITGAVPGMLRAYDLPDLAATLAPRQLIVVNPLNGEGKPAGNEQMHDEETVRKAFEARTAGAKFQILPGVPDNQAIGAVMDQWKGH